MRIRGRRSVAALVAAFAVALGAGTLFGYGLLAGWFEPGDVTGNTQGFEPAAIAPGDATAEEWPEYGRTPQRTRANTALALDPPYRRRWSMDAGSLVEFPPIITGGDVVVATNRGKAFSIRAGTGEVRWRRTLGGVVASSPAVYTLPGGRRGVLFTTMAGDVVALAPATGGVMWRLRLRSPIESSPLVVGTMAYVGTKDNRVLAVDLRRRRAAWTVRVPGAVKGSLALAGGNVIVGDYAGVVTALRARDGARRWQTTTPGGPLRGAGRFYAGPAVAYGRVYIGNVNGRVLALSAATGRINWVHGVDDYVYASAAVADRTVYVGSYDHRLYALDAVTGKVRWQRDARERISGSATVIGDLVWVSTLAKNPRQGVTIAYDTATGRERFRFPDGRYATPVGIKGRLILTGVRTVYGLEPR